MRQRATRQVTRFSPGSWVENVNAAGASLLAKANGAEHVNATGFVEETRPALGSS